MQSLPKKTIPLCLILILKTNHVFALSSYSIGAGIGETIIDGRNQSIRKRDVFSTAFDVNNENSFTYLGGTFASQGEFTNTRIIVGGGSSSFKIGSGFIYMNTHFDTEAQSWGLFSANPALQTEVNITGVPLYFRWTPLSTQKWHLNLDAYYMVAAQGELKIPLAGSGFSSNNITLRTNALKVANPQGYGMTIHYKINDDMGLQLNYFKESAQILPTTATIPQDPLSALSPTYVDGFSISNQTITLALSLLIE